MEKNQTRNGRPTTRIPEMVIGFLFSSNQKYVVLITKNRPEWQKGYMNGVGGKIEPGESPIQAMRREFSEEAGLEVEYWTNFVTIEFKQAILYVFCTFSDYYQNVKTITDEKVNIIKVSMINRENPHIIPNLAWLIPLALDKYQHSGKLLGN